MITQILSALVVAALVAISVLFHTAGEPWYQLTPVGWIAVAVVAILAFVAMEIIEK